MTPLVCTQIALVPAPTFGVFRRKGVGGQRGLARGDPSYARDSDLFSVPFFLCHPQEKGKEFWGSIFAVLWVLLVTNPISKPLPD